MEAWYELGEVVLHAGPLLGIPLADAAEPFARAASFDPGHAPALFHLSNVSTWTGDTTRVDSATRALRAVLGGAAPQQIEAQWAMMRGDAAVQDSILATIQLPMQEVMVRTLAAFGARDEALTRLDRLETGAGEPPLRTATVAVQPFLRTPAERLRDLRDRLLAWDPGPVRTAPLGPDEWDDIEPVLPQLRLYLLALLEAGLGIPGEAIRHADDLAALGGPPEIQTLAADLARHVRARVHFDQGRPAEALRILEGATFWDRSPWDERFSAVFAFEGPVLLRAEALFALGRYREALSWYASHPLGRSTHGYGLYRRAEILEALDQPDRAAEHYARFLDVWQDADADLQDLSTDARRRLEALVGEG
ncbi:MAG: hypothetical protein P8177_05650 [Gemmatimonadota bacterium]